MRRDVHGAAADRGRAKERRERGEGSRREEKERRSGDRRLAVALCAVRRGREREDASRVKEKGSATAVEETTERMRERERLSRSNEK